MPGPMRGAPMSLKKVDTKMLGRVLGRVLGYMLKKYWFPFLLVVICIVVTAISTLQGVLFMQKLYDDYIAPLLQSQTPDFSNLASALFQVGIVYAIGIVCA